MMHQVVQSKFTYVRPTSTEQNFNLRFQKKNWKKFWNFFFLKTSILKICGHSLRKSCINPIWSQNASKNFRQAVQSPRINMMVQSKFIYIRPTSTEQNFNFRSQKKNWKKIWKNIFLEFPLGFLKDFEPFLDRCRFSSKMKKKRKKSKKMVSGKCH